MGKNPIYIQLFSIHGLIRGNQPELGRNADTGGQVKYVLELAKTLGQSKNIRKVDLFTRYIDDKSLDASYSKTIEPLGNKVRIVRIRCGGARMIRKELLWRHLDEYVDNTLKFVKAEGDIPDVVHGHYADAGYVTRELADFWGVMMVFTGHSLGRVKKSDLQAAGMSDEQMNKKFHIDHRISVEEKVIDRADLIITSTRQEISEQYGKYDAGQNDRFCAIPPGIDIDNFFPFYDTPEQSLTKNEKVKQAQFFVQKELERFWVDSGKPIILALARPDHRKNISGLVTAYGENKKLQAIANLAVFAGIRKDISKMDDNEREVLTELLLLMDKFDLYGKLAIPKRHDVENEVPELYRIAAHSQGVFVNPAFKENFGLAIIEAMASGLPIVATNNGGPREIIENCHNGILVDVNDSEALSEAAMKILIDAELWKRYSQNGIYGVRQHYVWEAHCKKYTKKLDSINKNGEPGSEISDPPAIGKRISGFKKFLISDIDDTLLGDDQALAELGSRLSLHRSRIGFGLATGRPIESVKEMLKTYDLPHPDVIISSVGTEIYYGRNLLVDKGWKAHIGAQWHPDRIRAALEPLDFLNLQGKEAQRSFKISYFLKNASDHLDRIHQCLTDARLRYTLIYSRDLFLDILPYRASKGKAVRHLSYKWNIPLNKILVAGDSDNDADMLRGEVLGVVVGNYSSELEKLKGQRQIYFSPHYNAAGILDGIQHYHFFS